MEGSPLTQMLQLLAKFSIIGFVVGHMLALGMRLTVQEIIDPPRRLRLALLALAANFVFGPVFAYLSAQLISVVIPLEQGYVIGLIKPRHDFLSAGTERSRPYPVYISSTSNYAEQSKDAALDT
jgi:hypothetical protein